MGESAPTGPGAVHQPGARCKILLDQGCFSNLCGPCDSDYSALLDRLARSESARREAEERLIVAQRELAAEIEAHAMTKRDRDSHVQGYASERAARETWEHEFSVANMERLRLHNEVENLAERLGQFEAAGFPSVSVVLDRVESERAAREKVEAMLNGGMRDRMYAAESRAARVEAALLSLANVGEDDDGQPVLRISCGFHCETADMTELPLVWAALAEIGK